VTEISAKRLSDGISAEVPDWSREKKTRFWDPSRALIAAIRSHQRHVAGAGPIAGLARFLAKCRHHFWSIVTGADIPLMTRIAGGLMMPHPNGIVIHGDVEIGPNCLIMQNVTLGMSGRQGAPRIGGHVDISVGASILGPVTIGDHAVIGAHALIMKDVPAGAVMISPLAQIKPDNQANGQADS
jgi:serine O-acetyltransferase